MSYLILDGIKRVVFEPARGNAKHTTLIFFCVKQFSLGGSNKQRQCQYQIITDITYFFIAVLLHQMEILRRLLNDCYDMQSQSRLTGGVAILAQN